MGYGITVESFITPADRIKPEGFVATRQKYQALRLKKLLDVLGWETAPWREPSDAIGISTSCGHKRYAILLAVALAEERGWDSELADAPYGTAITPDAFKSFPHFLYRGRWTNYYLPVEIDPPLIYDEHEEGVEAFLISVGSSLHLEKEVARLEKAVFQKMQANGEDEIIIVPPSAWQDEKVVELGERSLALIAGIPTAKINVTWKSVFELCGILLRAARESQELNLPLQILG